MLKYKIALLFTSLTLFSPTLAMERPLAKEATLSFLSPIVTIEQPLSPVTLTQLVPDVVVLILKELASGSFKDASKNFRSMNMTCRFIRDLIHAHADTFIDMVKRSNGKNYFEAAQALGLGKLTQQNVPSHIESLCELCFRFLKNRVDALLVETEQGCSFEAAYERLKARHFKGLPVDLIEKFKKYYVTATRGKEKWLARPDNSSGGNACCALMQGGILRVTGYGSGLLADSTVHGRQKISLENDFQGAWEIKPGLILIAFYSDDYKERRLVLWDLSIGQIKGCDENHGNCINDAYLLSEKQVATASSDKTIKIWDLASAHCIKTINNGACAELLLVIAKRLLAVSSCSIKRWDLDTYECVKEVQRDFTGRAKLLLPKGRLAIMGYKFITIVHLVSGERLHELGLQYKEGDIAGLCLLKDGTLASLGQWGTLRIWDIETGCCHQMVEWGNICATSKLMQMAGGTLLFAGRNGNGEATFVTQPFDKFLEMKFKESQDKKPQQSTKTAALTDN